jgi:hypothetical protein
MGEHVASDFHADLQTLTADLKPLASQMAAGAGEAGGDLRGAFNDIREGMMSDLGSLDQSAQKAGEVLGHAGKLLSVADVLRSAYSGFEDSREPTLAGKLGDGARAMAISAAVDTTPFLGGADFLSQGAVNATAHMLVGDFEPAIKYDEAVDRGEKGPIIKGIADGTRLLESGVFEGAKSLGGAASNAFDDLEDLF